MIELYTPATAAGRQISSLFGVPGQFGALCAGHPQQAIPTR